MKKTLLAAAFLGLFAVTSCKKSANGPDTSTNTVNSINDIVVPSGFNWESSRNVTFNISVADTRFDTPTKKATFKIAIYNADPFAGTALTPVAVGSASTTAPFSTKLYLSTQINTVYIMKTAPDNSSIVQKQTLTSTSVALTLGAVDPTYVVSSTAASKQVTANPTSPDCSSGNPVNITASRSGLDMNSGDLYCVTADNVTIGLQNVNGGTLRICGNNVTVTGNLGSNGALVITSGHSATFTGNLNSSNASVTNFGTLTIPGNRADAGGFYNYGVCNIGGDCNMNGGSTFVNGGTLNIGGGWQGGTSNTATNNGTMVVNTNFQTNGTPFINNCSLYVKQNYLQSSATVQNYSLIKVDATTTLNDNVELGLYNGAMLLTNNIIVNGKIIGYGTTSLVKITGTTGFQNGGSVISNVQVYATQDLSSYSNRITSGATLGNSVYIPVTGCNSVGNGSPAIVDTDGDGVADNLDAYPNDPTKAYNITGATGTVAFEDLWPSKGDFDMNDLVMAYNYALVTNAANNVVTVTGNYTLLATGGTFGNAFGIEFPVSAANASGLKITNSSGVQSSGLFEAGQSKAVVILFTSMRSEMPTWNTKPGDIVSPAKTYSITFNVANGTSISSFGQDAYNPFIYNTTRGHEIHLSGKTPTTLADASLFGTADDNTSVAASRYYVTKTGLPYAINVPATFNYPTETTDITKAYSHFADWAVSGGASYTDWYSNVASGYRVTGNIFTK
ncbi:LruC domain-containing protein [Mucilaginibacter paludis]|uniref:DUF4842 domain-containing protein n=1 Tax=Mucilaginibacter paludis DSM 18603 TaxID=714943 RepID=H1Y079_9SPHI|nr:LruC domain-containing protein [Mucilaginibacter paludis]EHQ27988.1 hypothetical protein Mucpa_3896 [Mucilaginibacter paludis DSM 18603]